MECNGHAEWGGRRYHPFGIYLKERFERKVWKISIDAGMTCPNRDGTISRKGCTYCVREAHFKGPQFSYVPAQIALGIERLRARRKADRFIAYFQPGTNTFAPTEELRLVFDSIRGFRHIVGLAVGTRPDCAGNSVLDLLSGYSSDYKVWLELGLQSAHDATLDALNRGHGVSAFLDAYRRARGHPLRIVVHLIFGLPGEGREEIMETVRLVAGLRPDGIKIHPLQILHGTELADSYELGGFELLPREEYISIVADALEILPPETTIHRLTAEAPPDLLIAPDWCSRKQSLLDDIEAELQRRGTRQGSRVFAEKE
ncbi:MAG TPA: TIGR01212 family radical SAM protein [Acidobacteriota bacterium]|nr:TIGR01212 family radical SAM protein [Acidobacteriota bacterium]